MDYKVVAKSILDKVGGAENVKDATHCFTRLRLVLHDPSKASKDEVSKLEGVISVVDSGGQFQVVLGGKVNKVYDEFLPMVQGVEKKAAAEAPQEALKGDKGSVWNYILQTVGNIFTPIVPAIAASGLIKGLLSAAQRLGWVAADNSTYVILLAASNAIFYFMPIFLAYTTAKTLKCNKIIAMMLGAFLCMPAMVTMMETNFAVPDTIFGLPVVKMAFTIGESTKVFGYTESVIPIILAVIVLKWLEKGLTKIIPEMLQIILVPGLSLIIMVPVILVVVGPVGAYIGYGMQWLYSTVMGFSPLVGGALVGALWGVFVIFGAHRALLPVGLNDVAVTASIHKCGSGHNTLMCYAGAANFSQAGAALGVMLKTKSKKLRQVAGAATISAFLVGITEPAIYGCNLRKKRPMVCAIIAGALGGAIMGIGNASNHGFANNGILTIATYQCADNTTGQFVAYLIGIAVAFFGAAILTYIVGFEDDKDEELNAA